MDTRPDAEAAQLAIQRLLTGAERLRMALEMSQMARDLALAGMRARFPAWSEIELRKELLRQGFHSASLPAPLR